ncbi:uncharacterized protein LOC119280954 [Triticum dicoccoides]|uniref:uncharacterized protein LOC119280954 n=1 Tax=Triticum dicoccoides TaxID=85692 RepID=UPI00162DB70D|nr:uncharacterized protein LOC119280954 [Triticum dicoccoides]
MESGSARAVPSSKSSQSRVTFGDEDSIEEKRGKIESGSARAVASAGAPQSRVPLGADGRPLDGVMRASLIRHLKHADGSIFRSNGYWTKVYRLQDASETCLEPMMMTEPLASCMPDGMVCGRQHFRTMLQIFSLKLAYTSSHVTGPVQLYGYVAVRDLLNPMRNYIFNRTRDDPFVVEHDGLIQMTGPKRGIRMGAPVLIEFDMKVKRGVGEAEDDLQLVDCVACLNDITSRHATKNRRRIDGDCGAVDITYSLLRGAAEATVQVGISELAQDSGLIRLNAALFYTKELSAQIQLFDGVVAAEASELSRTVVAVAKGGQLLVSLMLNQTGGSGDCAFSRSCTFPVQKHGNHVSVFKLGLATIEVKVTWSTLDIPGSLLGPNCFQWEFMAAEDLGYEGD